LLNAVLHRRFLPFVLSFRLAEDSGTRGADQVTVKPMEAAMLVSAALATAPLTVAHPGASMASSSCISSSSATSDGSTSCSTLFFIGDSFLSLLCSDGTQGLGRSGSGEGDADGSGDADDHGVGPRAG